MDKIVSAAFIASVLLASCAITPTTEPFRFGVGATTEKQQVATLWAGTAPRAYMAIQTIDGQKLPVQKGGGLPYSVTLAPGKHEIGLYLRPLADLPLLQTQRVGSTVVHVDLVAGHDYAFFHEDVADGSGFKVNVEDMGTNANCHYETLGRASQGIVPLFLDCQKHQ